MSTKTAQANQNKMNLNLSSRCGPGDLGVRIDGDMLDGSKMSQLFPEIERLFFNGRLKDSCLSIELPVLVLDHRCSVGLEHFPRVHFVAEIFL